MYSLWHGTLDWRSRWHLFVSQRMWFWSRQLLSNPKLHSVTMPAVKNNNNFNLNYSTPCHNSERFLIFRRPGNFDLLHIMFISYVRSYVNGNKGATAEYPATIVQDSTCAYIFKERDMCRNKINSSGRVIARDNLLEDACFHDVFEFLRPWLECAWLCVWSRA